MKRISEVSAEELYTMNLHEKQRFFNETKTEYIKILSVLNGWIYTFYIDNKMHHSVLVPLR